MSSYSFRGHARIWTPRDEEENHAIFSGQKQPSTIKLEPSSECPPVYITNDPVDPIPSNEHFPQKEKWSLKQLIRLLRLYGAHRCLWDTRDPDNRNRKLRKAALLDITAAMGGGVRCAQVVQKINVLKATYRYEKRRIKQRIRKGIGAKTKLKWFALADAFLRDVPRAEKLRKVEDMDSDSDLEDAVVFTIDPESLIPLEDEENDYANVTIKEESIDSLPSYNDENTALNFTTEAQIKLEENDDHNHTQLLSDAAPSSAPNTKWTEQHSLQFVQLLGQRNLLWETPNCDREAQEMTSIAEAMQMPINRINKRVQILRNVCKEELQKITENPSYTPLYVWWLEAEKFKPSSAWEEKHFVDANEVPPPTPLNIALMRATAEANNEVETCKSDSPLSAVNMELEDDISQSVSTMSDQQPATETQNSSTKLIWNGLEEDLLGGKWSLKHSVKFLRLYGAHRCLWDLNDPDYRSRELRNAAIEDIAAAMGYGLNAEYVARKIKIFRITYMQHRKRMLEAIKQGKEPEIQLRWFPLADSFLRPHIGLRSIKEHEREMPQFDFQYVYANLNLIDPALLTDFRGKGTQNVIEIGAEQVEEGIGE